MRIIHTGDLHLDKISDRPFSKNSSFQSVSSPQRWRTLQNLISYANNNSADLLLICGDLFHCQPNERMLREADSLFSALTHTQVVIIAGNHDFLSPTSLLTNYHWSGAVTVLPPDLDSSVCFPSLKTVIHGFSYSFCQSHEPLGDGFIAPKDRLYHILMLHGGDSDHVPMNFSALEQSGFDYIALGHIHKPLIFPGKQMAYCGSLEPLDHTETGNHGFIQADFLYGEVEVSFIPFSHARFVPVSLQLTPEDTLFTLRRSLSERISRGEPGDLYLVSFTGNRDPELMLSPDSFSDLSQIYELADNAYPWYDYQTLLKQHGSDLVGQYIRSFLPPGAAADDLDDLQRQALYFGVNALLTSK